MTRLIDLDNKETIKALVNSFLSWKLPARFSPDGGIKFTLLPHLHDTHQWPIGTHLFTADQAEEMIKHILNNAPTVEADSGENEPITYLAFYSYDDGLERIEGFEEVDKTSSKGFPVYTSPQKREWRGLSEAEQAALLTELYQDGHSFRWLITAASAKLKEVNGYE